MSDADDPGAASVLDYAGRLAALEKRIGIGVSDAGTSTALRQLIADLDAVVAAATPRDAQPLRWWAAAARDALALCLRHQGDAAAAAAEYGAAAQQWDQLGETARGQESAAARSGSALAAGGSVDTAVGELLLQAHAAGLPGLQRAFLLVRLARIAADVEDHFEARRHCVEAAGLLTELGYRDPTDDAEAAFTAWMAAQPASSAGLGALREVGTVLTTWYELLGVRGAIGDGWAREALAALPRISRRLLTESGAAPDDATVRSHQAIELARRLDELQDAYDNGPDTPVAAQWQRLYDATRDVASSFERLGQPSSVAMARTLEADLLVWANRPLDADAVLSTARAQLASVVSMPEAARSAALIELIRRQIAIAAGAQDSVAVSRLAGEGVDVVEADRQRLTLPYLQDSYLRNRRLVYVAGMAAARRLDDLELMLERADLVKARGSLPWLPAPPESVADIRASLAHDEAVVYHLWADRTVLYVLTVDRDEIVCDRTLFTDAERAELDDLTTDLAGLTGSMSWVDKDIPGWGAQLMPVDGADLLADKTRVYLSPHGVLHQLPLHGLTWRDAPLIESFAVSHVPNFAGLTRRASSASGPAIVIGISTFARAPRLPSAQAEAAAVAAGHPGSHLLLGPDANLATFDAMMRDGRLAAAGLLHLATHGQDGPMDDPLAARFLLADGEVVGTSLREARIGADLVVLSACWSAQRAVLGRDGTELFGDEVYGLQSAFFAAGARQVLGSMWPADDLTTTALMTRFHRLLRDGTPADVALQSAMLASRRAEDLLYKWGPYKLTVLGRAPAAHKEI